MVALGGQMHVQERMQKGGPEKQRSHYRVRELGS